MSATGNTEGLGLTPLTPWAASDAAESFWKTVEHGDGESQQLIPGMSIIHPCLLSDKKSYCSKMSSINHCSHTGEHLLCAQIIYCLPSRKTRRVGGGVSYIKNNIRTKIRCKTFLQMETKEKERT